MQLVTTIRRATVADVDAITALVSEAYTPYIARIGKKPAPMLDDYRQVIADADVYVVLHDSVLVGVVVMCKEDNEMLLVNVAVLPRCKGQGIGKMLMTFCEDYTQRAGCTAVRLYTHEQMTENIEIYKKLGYLEAHRAMENGFARVFMRKAIPVV
ncbi:MULTISPECIES: GNAT family N-acetyltransferase [Pseudomonas]|uniref:GNAT family N-acetyltransferase n=1 Tax=Pseudomonas TaxID=286 RepID=UPI001F08AEB8|nr:MULTISPECIES: GNAT family N-acetyltransferase [Pseudomonas]